MGNFNERIKNKAADVAVSAMPTALKWTGIVLLIGVGGYATYKLIGGIGNSVQQKSELDALTEGLNESMITHDRASFNNYVNALWKAFDQDSYSWTWCNYDESAIKRVLEQLNNIHDWKYLVKVFGIRQAKKIGDNGKHHLAWFLQQDDDVAEYQAILTKKNITITL